MPLEYAVLLLDEAQILWVTTPARHVAFSCRTLQRSEIEHGAMIMLEKELHESIAEPANAVVEDKVSSREAHPCRDHVRCIP